jgi:hypothetical protein
MMGRNMTVHARSLPRDRDVTNCAGGKAPRWVRVEKSTVADQKTSRGICPPGDLANWKTRELMDKTAAVASGKVEQAGLLRGEARGGKWADLEVTQIANATRPPKVEIDL